MKRRSFFFILIYCLSFFSLSAQNEHPGNIDLIVFQGLKRTKASFLRPFLQSKVGSPAMDSLIQVDIQTLKNIPSVGNAWHWLDTKGDSVKIFFTIVEVKTFLPILNFGGIKNNFWFKLGFVDINWGGKGQLLSMHYQNIDRRHSGEIFYNVPFFRRTFWGFSGSLSRWASTEPLYFPEGRVNYDYDILSGGFTLMRHFGLRRSLEVGGTYFIETYKKDESQPLSDPPGPDNLKAPKILSKLQYTTDLVNRHFQYLQGHSWRFVYQNVYNTLGKNYFNTLQFQSRQFYRIGKKGNFAIRLQLAIATNISTPFAPFVVDSYVNIRGVGNRIDRGTAQAVLNIEYRYTLLDKSDWAIQSVVFSDNGTWRGPGGKLKDLLDTNQFRQFVGTGVRIIYQKYYGATLRIDYGIDVFNKDYHGWVIGLGQYF